MLQLSIPQPYHFKASLNSYGWIALAPCRWDDENAAFQRVERLSSGQVVMLTVTDGTEALSVKIEAENAPSPADLAEIEQNLRYSLRLDEELSDFYTRARQHPSLWQRVSIGTGRLLRSPTLFEDVVKTICTTNTTWRQTKQMLSRIVSHLGDASPLNPTWQAFPTPQKLADVDDAFYKDTLRLGYRGAYIKQLAQEVASGQRDLEALKTSGMDNKTLKKTLKSIKGVGDYAAHTLMMSLGRYDELAIDSEVRALVKQKYTNGADPSDAEIQAIYADWGAWKYLAYWFDSVD